MPGKAWSAILLLAAASLVHAGGLEVRGRLSLHEGEPALEGHGSRWLLRCEGAARLGRVLGREVVLDSIRTQHLGEGRYAVLAGRLRAANGTVLARWFTPPGAAIHAHGTLEWSEADSALVIEEDGERFRLSGVSPELVAMARSITKVGLVCGFEGRVVERATAARPGLLEVDERASRYEETGEPVLIERRLHLRVGEDDPTPGATVRIVGGGAGDRVPDLVYLLDAGVTATVRGWALRGPNLLAHAAALRGLADRPLHRRIETGPGKARFEPLGRTLGRDVLPLTEVQIHFHRPDTGELLQPGSHGRRRPEVRALRLTATDEWLLLVPPASAPEQGKGMGQLLEGSAPGQR